LPFCVLLELEFRISILRVLNGNGNQVGLAE
jgi:hypothetical protein